MAFYDYRARDRQGILLTGKLDAASKREVEQELGSKGLIPISVVQTATESSDFFTNLLSRLTLEDLSFFTRQFYTLVKAGMDIDGILSTLARQASKPKLRAVLNEVRKDIAAGTQLSVAFGKFPQIFNDLYLGMIAAGEEAGLLEDVLKELSELLDAQQQTRSQIKSATFYPKLVIVMMIVVVSIMMTVVLPKFVIFYNNFHAQLPLPTRILISGVNFVHAYAWPLLVGSGLLYLLGRYFFSTARGSFLLDRLILAAPIFGKVYQQLYNARFGRVLGTLYRSGISLPRSLEITSATVGNTAYAQMILASREAVNRGQPLSESMQGKPYFSPLIIDAVAVGEKSGSLDQLLLSVAEFYTRESEITLKKLSTLIEPFLLFIVFGGMALLVLAIYLPILNMNSILF